MGMDQPAVTTPISPPAALTMVNNQADSELVTLPTTTTPETPKSPTTSTSSVLLMPVPPSFLTTKTVTPPVSLMPPVHHADPLASPTTQSPSHPEMAENYSTKSLSQPLHKSLMSNLPLLNSSYFK